MPTVVGPKNQVRPAEDPEGLFQEELGCGPQQRSRLIIPETDRRERSLLASLPSPHVHPIEVEHGVPIRCRSRSLL